MLLQAMNCMNVSKPHSSRQTMAKNYTRTFQTTALIIVVNIIISIIITSALPTQMPASADLVSRIIFTSD